MARISGIAQIDIGISRAGSVLFFAILAMALQWLLALGTVFVIIWTIVHGRKIEFNMFTWMTALLFALPPLRNLMPGVPPIGTLSDFAAFFWAEGIVALALCALIITWLLRPPVR